MKPVIFFLLIFFDMSTRCWAASEQDESLEQKFIDSNIVISEWFDGVAEGLDLFLAGKKLTNRKNESGVKISNTTFVDDELNRTNSTGAGVSLRLPNVEQYWNLKFTSYDESKERGVRSRPELRRTPRQQNYGASVGVFQKLGDVRTSFQPRVELSDPLKVSHSLIFESIAEVKNFKLNPKLEFFANPEQGTGIFQAINFHFRLTRIYSLTLVNEGEYEDKKRQYSVTNGFSIGQMITPRKSFSYNLYFGSNNRPSYHLESYTFSIAWNHLIYRNILSYQIAPQLNFEKTIDFTGKPGISFSVDLNF